MCVAWRLPVALQAECEGLALSRSHRPCPCMVLDAMLTHAAVSMGSGDHHFNLVEILSQNYSVEGECEEPSRCSDKPKEELEKNFISQSSDMPFDELLALYGYEASDPISEQGSEGGDVAPNLLDMTLDKEQIAKDLLSGEEEEETQPSADDLTPSVTSHKASDLFPNQSGSRFLADEVKKPGSSASSDTEEDSLPANKCKKVRGSASPQPRIDHSHHSGVLRSPLPGHVPLLRGGMCCSTPGWAGTEAPAPAADRVFLL
ncbi:mesoderm induction early response protein 2-like [Cebus imitator]|uniref:mesoderm induction early response protein 2-like n=1 Tax=Cebus imitator TaxID=2715852 RepID=UPI001898FE4A|nr:mesoderm induction early response protein 2-like [Cebus imitator]